MNTNLFIAACLLLATVAYVSANGGEDQLVAPDVCQQTVESANRLFEQKPEPNREELCKDLKQKFSVIKSCKDSSNSAKDLAEKIQTACPDLKNV